MLAIKISFIYLIYLAEGHLNDGLLSISITRQNRGDVFSIQGEKQYREACVGLSGGTAVASDENEAECRCQQQHPVYRDDLNICVDDIQECSLVPFVTGTIVRKIPYVFLPLKGQIVYPSAEIIVSENGAPVCVVSGGQYLGRNGWMNLRNNSDTEPPFRLFRDEGRTYLQWFGETSMRMAMEGRIILVHLMCKDVTFTEEPTIFTPCIAFRVAGNPSVREVMFSTDVHLAPENSAGLTKREYIAIGLCSLFLAIVYVASVFLYLHWRKQRHRKMNKKNEEGTQLTLGEEGIIKNNPLLQANRHLGVCTEDNAGYMTDSNSCGSDPDRISDLLCLDDDELTTHQNLQTSAIIHPCDLGYGETTLNQDPNSIERLPEENVSIIETLEAKEVHPETIKAIVSATGRRKLYFNPSYFEPELLKAPPPAALEFLVKIREVIAIAKHKMSNKKFSPSLLGIPEEEGSFKTESNVPRNGSLTPETTGRQQSIPQPSPETKPQNFKSSEPGSLVSNDFCCPSDAKQKIIQKWLEDVPVIMSKDDKSTKSNHQEAQEKSPDKRPFKKPDSRQTAETSNSKQGNKTSASSNRQEKRRPSTKARPPPLPPQSASKSNQEKIHKPEIEPEHPATTNNKDTKSHGESNPCNSQQLCARPSSPPPSINPKKDNDRVGRQEKSQQYPYTTKNLMDAVIQELTGFKKPDKSNNQDKKQDWIEKWARNREDIDESADKKETNEENGSGGGDDEDNDSAKNLLGDLKRGQSVKETSSSGSQDEHEYEIILLNGEIQMPEKDRSKRHPEGYNLSEVFSKSERNEGYSLVSEVYVNDGHNCRNSDYPSNGTSGAQTDKISYEVMNEKTSRLTIHVKDSPRQNKDVMSESDNFEPDTLERKQDKTKNVQRIKNEIDAPHDRYSNQRFHDLDLCKKKDSSENGENFTDSLERPTILLKTNGSFKRNSLEKDVNELFRNLNWARMENFGSLREIYEAKSRNHRRRTETTSLIDSVNSESDCISTLSWSEERRNKLLHRGIVLHIDEDICSQTKARFPQTKSSKHGQRISLKSPQSSRSNSKPPPRLPFSSKNANPLSLSPLRDASAPLPPPRSLPISPEPNHNARSMTPSPVNGMEIRKTSGSSPSPPPAPSSLSSFVGVNNNNNNNTVVRVFTKSECNPRCHSFLTPTAPKSLQTPPRPPKAFSMSASNPPLPPRISKPPLPPKTSKSTKPKLESSKFATRPLPPLPLPRPGKNPAKDIETVSILSGASADSLNSSEYESFYTMPYEEEDDEEDPCKNSHSNQPSAVPSANHPRKPLGNHLKGHRSHDPDKKSLRKRIKAVAHKVDDSGYLSTDSSESYCPQILLPSHIPRIPEGVESLGGQNSETEESICDGASESGAESTATDSFFYGNFNKGAQPKPSASQVYSYSLRLSDVEVNSDTERHCVPIMVRP